jgi:hypothetical protein
MIVANLATAEQENYTAGKPSEPKNKCIIIHDH